MSASSFADRLHRDLDGEKFDLDTIAAAAELVGPLGQKMLKEIGNLEQRHRGTKEGLEELEKVSAQRAQHYEAAGADFASRQREHHQTIAALDREIEEKRQEVTSLNATIAQLRANLQAA